jgi:hypothetical protein
MNTISIAKSLLLYLGVLFIHWTWRTTKEDHLGVLVGQRANLHAVQITHSTGLAQPEREPVIHRGHGGFSHKERRHAHHSLL